MGPARVDPAIGELVSGALKAKVSPEGMVSFSPTGDGRELLAEQRTHFSAVGPRMFPASEGSQQRVEQRFKANAGEKLYGLGQHLHGRFDQKGASGLAR